MKYQLEEKTIQAALNYLGTQPFQEVAPLVNAIQTELQPQLEKNVEKKDKK